MKPKITACLLFIFTAAHTLKAQENAEQLYRQLHNPSDKKIMVVAHRGDWRNAPENSLQAFVNAADMGVDIVELDLAKTKDSAIVIMHDKTIDRTTDGKGKPGDYTLSELRKFHLKNGLGRVTRHNIPTLQEVMEKLKGRVLVNLDKSFPYYREAYAILQKTGTLKQGLFKAEVTYDSLKTRYPELLQKITFMAVVNLDKPGAAKTIRDFQQQIKPVAFELNFASDTSSILSNNRFINQRGSKIWINALWASLNAGHDDDKAVDDGDTKDSWDWIIARGATMIQTDRPKELLFYLRKKGLHK